MSEPKADTALGYLVEAETFERLVRIASKLQGGSDRERDVGHRLWLICNEIREHPVRS